MINSKQKLIKKITKTLLDYYDDQSDFNEMLLSDIEFEIYQNIKELLDIKFKKFGVI